LEEQMISPLPDIKELPVDDEVEFLILACDGIWNFMSSQEVVDFVRPKLKDNPDNLSTICEDVSVCTVMFTNRFLTSPTLVRV